MKARERAARSGGAPTPTATARNPEYIAAACAVKEAKKYCEYMYARMRMPKTMVQSRPVMACATFSENQGIKPFLAKSPAKPTNELIQIKVSQAPVSWRISDQSSTCVMRRMVTAIIAVVVGFIPVSAAVDQRRRARTKVNRRIYSFLVKGPSSYSLPKASFLT